MNVIETIRRWYPSSWIDAQTAHVGWGAVIVLTCGTFNLGWLLTVAILGFWIIIKEFGFDLVVERDTIELSSIDAMFYVLGGGIAWSIQWLASLLSCSSSC